jgi:O-methyltransferase
MKIRGITMMFSVKKYLKKIIRWMEKVLPEKTFNVLYKKLFSLYKNMAPYGYLCSKGSTTFLNNGGDQWSMAKNIFHIMPYSLVGVGGLEVTYRAVKDVCERNIRGDLIELGVARGGCAALMASIAFNKEICGEIDRKLWLFDSYEGLPDPTDMDFNPDLGDGTGDHARPLPKGSCLGQLNEVQDLMFKKNDFPKEKIEFIKGWFDKTVPVTKKDIQEIAVLRIDGDWYESTKCCLENLYENVTAGGYVIIDDYQSCYGCKRAVDEFIQNRRLNPDIKFDGRGGCYFKKL